MLAMVTGILDGPEFKPVQSAMQELENMGAWHSLFSGLSSYMQGEPQSVVRDCKAALERVCQCSTSVLKQRCVKKCSFDVDLIEKVVDEGCGPLRCHLALLRRCKSCFNRNMLTVNQACHESCIKDNSKVIPNENNEAIPSENIFSLYFLVKPFLCRI